MKTRDDLFYEASKFLQSDSFNMYFSPGRVNLIGEHLDYNGGHVFPCSLDIGNTFCVIKRKDKAVRLFSEVIKTEAVVDFNLNEKIELNGSWTDYIKGAVLLLRSKGYKIDFGFEIYMDGDLPSGAGLSSSASISSGIIFVLNDLYSLQLSKKEIAIFAKEIENNYIGVNCGIMDSYSIVFGKKDMAIYLDTKNIEHKDVPLELGEYILVISNTNKKRSLKTSAYNDRRNECEKASEILGVDLALSSLEKLKEKREYLSENEYKRAEYVISEEKRTLLSKKALENGDLKLFGKYLNESHQGLKDKFEVTGTELDTLQKAAIDSGAIGSRMTGAGFGGCTISLVHKDNLRYFTKNVTDIYKNIISYKPSHYIVETGPGVYKMEV